MLASVMFVRAWGLSSVSEPLEAKAGLIVSDNTLDLVSNKNNDSLSPLEQKKIEQSAKMKEVWAKRKAKANQG